MKKNVVVLFILVFFYFISCDINKLNPIDYHHKIKALYEELDSMMVVFSRDVYAEESTVDTLQNDYEKSLDMVKRNLEKLYAIKELRDDPNYLKSVIDFYLTCDNVIKTDIKSIVDIFSDGEWDEDKGLQVDESMELFYRKIVKKENSVNDAQDAFSTKYGIVIP